LVAVVVILVVVVALVVVVVLWGAIFVLVVFPELVSIIILSYLDPDAPTLHSLQYSM